MKLTGDRNQCQGCKQYFNSTHAFDKHRAGEHEGGHRYCLTADAMRAKGMVLVPREPTHEMLYAMAELDGWRKGDRDHPMFTRWRDYWNAALYAAPQAVPAPVVREPLTDERLQRAYALGWIAASSWAKRDDLLADMGSLAYVAEMADALQACGIGGAGK